MGRRACAQGTRTAQRADTYTTYTASSSVDRGRRPRVMVLKCCEGCCVRIFYGTALGKCVPGRVSRQQQIGQQVPCDLPDSAPTLMNRRAIARRAPRHPEDARRLRERCAICGAMVSVLGVPVAAAHLPVSAWRGEASLLVRRSLGPGGRTRAAVALGARERRSCRRHGTCCVRRPALQLDRTWPTPDNLPTACPSRRSHAARPLAGRACGASGWTPCQAFAGRSNREAFARAVDASSRGRWTPLSSPSS